MSLYWSQKPCDVLTRVKVQCLSVAKIVLNGMYQIVCSDISAVQSVLAKIKRRSLFHAVTFLWCCNLALNWTFQPLLDKFCAESGRTPVLLGQTLGSLWCWRSQARRADNLDQNIGRLKLVSMRVFGVLRKLQIKLIRFFKSNCTPLVFISY